MSDTRDAFNSASWTNITNVLRTIITPKYLQNIVPSYFSDRVLCYDTSDGPKQYNVTSAVPQGSVLGPLLWNIMYDGILRIRKPKGVTIIGYADDSAITEVAKTIDEVRVKAEETISTVKSWPRTAGLCLADHKTESVLLSSREKVETLEIRTGSHLIRSNSY